MDIPITEPHLSANLTDQSQMDDHINQDKVVIQAQNGSQIFSNSGNGNGREFTRMMSTVLILFISLVCDALICMVLWQGQTNMERNIIDKFEKSEKSSQLTHKELKEAQDKLSEAQKRQEERHNEVIKKADETHNDMMKKAKEGTIWLLRDDIIKSIDFHEAMKKITQLQYRRMKDEFDYYTSIGGNHDVKERYNLFTAKILSGEIKVSNEIDLKKQ